MSSRVVARYLDGQMLKGMTMDVNPNRPKFHVRPEDAPQVPVDMAELKALFFVRTYQGNSAHDEQLEPDPNDIRARGSVLVAVRFSDGEEVVGMTFRYPPDRDYFFVVPVDAASNNIRILVNRAAVVSMRRVELPA
jgi:hypothetical protein